MGFEAERPAVCVQLYFFVLGGVLNCWEASCFGR